MKNFLLILIVLFSLFCFNCGKKELSVDEKKTPLAVTNNLSKFVILNISPYNIPANIIKYSYGTGNENYVYDNINSKKIKLIEKATDAGGNFKDVISIKMLALSGGSELVLNSTNLIGPINISGNNMYAGIKYYGNSIVSLYIMPNQGLQRVPIDEIILINYTNVNVSIEGFYYKDDPMPYYLDEPYNSNLSIENIPYDETQQIDRLIISFNPHETLFINDLYEPQTIAKKTINSFYLDDNYDMLGQYAIGLEITNSPEIPKKTKK